MFRGFMKYDTTYLRIRICLALAFFILIFYFKVNAYSAPQLSACGNFPPYFSLKDGKVSGLGAEWFGEIMKLMVEKYKTETDFLKNPGIVFELSLHPQNGKNAVSLPLKEFRWGFLCRSGSGIPAYGKLKPEGAAVCKDALDSVLEVVTGSKDYVLLPELTSKYIAKELDDEAFVFKSLKAPSGFIYLNVSGPLAAENINTLKKAVRDFRALEIPHTFTTTVSASPETVISQHNTIIAYVGVGALAISGASAFSIWAFFRKKLRKTVESAGALNTIFRATVTTMDDLLFVIDRDFRILRTNIHKYRKDLERNPEKAFCYELIRNQNAPCSNCRIAQMFDNGRPMSFMDEECGIGIFRDCKAVPLFDNVGQVCGIVKILRPVDGKRHFDIMPFLKLVFDVVSEDVVVTDEHYSIIYVNRAYEHSSGKPLCEFIGKYPAFFEKKFQDREDYRSLTRSMLQGCSWHGYLNEPAADGGVSRKEVFVAPFLPDKEGPGFFIFIAAPASISSKLKHSNRIELLGFIAGAITHDFNNILMMIMSNAELAGGLYSGGGKVDNALKRIINTGSHARHLVENIERFYKRRDKTEYTILSLKKVVKEAADEIEIILPSNIIFEKNIAESLRPVRGDETEIYQIILNLCMNAVNAMREKKGSGRLILSLSNVEPENDLITEGLSLRDKKSSSVKLSVADTGTGMDENTVNKIYEPFFTARLDGKGSGLGLAIVKDIVDGMGGEICVRSTPGEGTAFDVYFPGCTQDACKKEIEVL